MGLTVFLTLIYIKDGTPPGPSKCESLFVSYMMHTGAGVKTESSDALGEIDLSDLYARK